MKIERQLKINELIQEYNVETQEELSERLKAAGFDVTQATISRDIRELRLTKISTEQGKQKYIILSGNDQQLSDKFIRVFKDAVLNMDYAQNIVVLKTVQGMAMAVCATIDAMDNSEILGSIAGDDTIFCLTRTEKTAIELINKLSDVIKNRD